MEDTMLMEEEAANNNSNYMIFLRNKTIEITKEHKDNVKMNDS